MRSTAVVVLASLLAVAHNVAAQPSSNLADYVVFADELLRPRALQVPCGDVGVNAPTGLLKETSGITVAGNCVGNTVRMDGLGSCGDLFANFTVNPTQPATPFTPPVLSGSLATNCGFPGSFPVCDLGQPVTVDPGTTLSLPPGTYGTVVVKGGRDQLGMPNGGVLELQGGSYTFCDVKLASWAAIHAMAPVTVNIGGKLKMSYANFLGPDTGHVASDVVVYVNGTSARYSRDSQVVARICGPLAICGVLPGGHHFGSLACRKVKVKNTIFTCASPSGAFVD